MRVPLIALEIFLGLVPLAWAVWELVALRRERRRDIERARRVDASLRKPPDG